MNIQVAVISLATAHDRRSLLTEHLKFSEKIDWSFFDALTHESPTSGLETDVKGQLREYGRQLTKEEIGCFKSHFSLIDHFLHRGTAEWLLVLEDDVWMDPDFSIAGAIRFAEKHNIKYIRLFAKMYKPADIVGMLDNFRQVIRFRTDPYGAQAYLINKRGCSSLLSQIKAIDAPFDDVLGRFWEHGLDAYSVFPFPVVERNISSSLTPSRDAASAERVNGANRGIARRIVSKTRKAAYNFVHTFRKNRC